MESLWQERFKDKIRIEGIAIHVAIHDYSIIYIGRVTIIHAIGNFKNLNFKNILQQHEIENAERYRGKLLWSKCFTVP